MLPLRTSGGHSADGSSPRTQLILAACRWRRQDTTLLRTARFPSSPMSICVAEERSKGAPSERPRQQSRWAPAGAVQYGEPVVPAAACARLPLAESSREAAATARPRAQSEAIHGRMTRVLLGSCKAMSRDRETAPHPHNGRRSHEIKMTFLTQNATSELCEPPAAPPQAPGWHCLRRSRGSESPSPGGGTSLPLCALLCRRQRLGVLVSVPPTAAPSPVIDGPRSP